MYTNMLLRRRMAKHTVYRHSVRELRLLENCTVHIIRIIDQVRMLYKKQNNKLKIFLLLIIHCRIITVTYEVKIQLLM